MPQSNTRPKNRRLVPAMVAFAIIALTSIAGASPALAAPAPQTGWVRVAHLSPDTRSVDVRLTQLGRDSAVVRLDSVAYGAISAYQPLSPGTYLVTMTRAGSRASSTPVARSSVTVVEGKSTTVAAYGRNARLRLKAFPDELATPAAGIARIRLLQASATVPTVSVVTSTGTTIATQARGGTATGYIDVPAGTWTLLLQAKSRDFSTTVSLVPGSVTTLVVLDTARGALTARPIVDSAAAQQIPVGAVQTGGGFLARDTSPASATMGRILGSTAPEMRR
ncbi:DUF4397 domain-containing protein [Glaciihabitans sp. INWT7]|uniref:DUF4397 domain-containing protein n=1 Tax=Glaciihabitans sp. INWT7 TaxID=2596912 RepID=UPI0016293B3F|nr:DUF4397 domain-containing protein [Glaciihabitans sp. INWT7]QNE47298.1 DUF4397 domain-containing protein [Glaciihabitans sp. INWT7]